MKNKTAGFCFALVSALFTIVILVLTLVYKGRGGQVNNLVIAALACAIACEISLLFGEQIWTDFTGIIAAVLVTYAMMTVLSDGIWNISEAINGIKMVGLPELAGMNYAMFGLSLVTVLLSVAGCFMKKSR